MTASSLTLAPEQAALESPSLPLHLPAIGTRSTTLRKDLHASLGDGAAFSLMVGLGETYLPAFVLALGMGEIAAGLITTLPLMLGAILQLVTPWAVDRLGSPRRWVVICARAQAGSLLLLLPLVLFPYGPLRWTVFLSSTLYWGAGMATGPAWNTWVERLVPARIRPRFFATRSRACQAFSLSGFLLGGLALQAGQNTATPILVFGFLFAAASVARFRSAGYLAAQSEGDRQLRRQSETSDPLTRPTGLFPTGRHSARLVLYLLAMQSAIYLAGPFFTPFLLSELRFSYVEYTLLISLGFAGKMIAVPFWGRVAQRHGARRLLWIGGLGIAPLSSLWVVSQSTPYLVVVQLLSGITWAAHELAILLMFVDAIPQSQRTRLLTYYNLGNATAMVCGGVLGGVLFELLGQSHSAYLTLFALSSLARITSLTCLFAVPNPVRPLQLPVTRTIAVRPAAGSIEQPILATLPRDVERTAA